MPLPYNKRTLAAKLEGTSGVYEALTSAEAGFRVIEPDMKLVSAVVATMKSDGTLGTDVSPTGSKYTTLSFKSRLHGDGSSGAPGWASIFFPACGMPAVGTGGDTFTTSSTEANWKTFSAALNRAGRRRFGRGFMGNGVMSFKSGEVVEVAWNFTGGYHEISDLNPDDTAQLTGMSYEAVVPATFGGASALTIDGSTAFKISSATLDLGAAVAARHDANSLGGFIGGYIGNIMPKITLDPEAVLNATYDWAEAYRTSDQFTVVFVVGSASGNTITITCTNCQVTKFPEEGNRNDWTIDNVELQVNGTVSVVFS